MTFRRSNLILAFYNLDLQESQKLVRIKFTNLNCFIIIHLFLIPYINMSYYDLSKLAPEKEHQEIVKALEDVDSNPMVGTSWYVISRTWWDKWENYMKNPEKADESGPIDADDILIPEEDYVKDYENESSYDNNILKAGIRAENDFKLVTGQIWRSLNKKYTLKNERA